MFALEYPSVQVQKRFCSTAVWCKNTYRFQIPRARLDVLVKGPISHMNSLYTNLLNRPESSTIVPTIRENSSRPLCNILLFLAMPDVWQCGGGAETDAANDEDRFPRAREGKIPQGRIQNAS
ncbi:hypothetical protein Trydic_g19367 [Trypoxylus dichotomus]